MDEYVCVLNVFWHKMQ